MGLRLLLGSNGRTGLLYPLRSSARPHSNNTRCSKPDTVLAPSSLPPETSLFHSRMPHPFTLLHSQPLTPSSLITPSSCCPGNTGTSADLTRSPGCRQLSILALQIEPNSSHGPFLPTLVTSASSLWLWRGCQRGGWDLQDQDGTLRTSPHSTPSLGQRQSEAFSAETERGGLKNVPVAPLSPIPAQDGPRRAGAVRGNPKVLDVGAGDTEGEQMGEELEGKEEREAESGLRPVVGVPPPAPATPTAGALDRNNKEPSTNLRTPAVLPDESLGGPGPCHTPITLRWTVSPSCPPRLPCGPSGAAVYGSIREVRQGASVEKSQCLLLKPPALPSGHPDIWVKVGMGTALSHRLVVKNAPKAPKAPKSFSPKKLPLYPRFDFKLLIFLLQSLKCCLTLSKAL